MPDKLEGLVVVERSSDALAPPYVMRRGVDQSQLYSGLKLAFQSRVSQE